MLRAFLLVTLIIGATTAHALIGDFTNLPPQDGYKRFKTPHFEVIYPETLRSLAPEAGAYLEEAHKLMADHFVPQEQQNTARTVVILTDNTDLSNGLTLVTGHQGLVLFMVPPDPYSSIGEYDNWLRNLVIHEYAHYLTLSPTRGVFKVLRYIFGDVLLPNSAWPAWLSEGLAVYAETNFTKLGRGSGAYFATITRDSVKRGTLGRGFLSFDEIMGPRPEYPFGEAPYYAGYYIVDELQRELGTEGAKAVTYAGAGRVTWFLNGTLESARDALVERGRKVHDPTGDLVWRNLWQKAIERQESARRREIAELESTGAADPETLTPAGAVAQGARLSPDDSAVAYTYRSGHELSSLRVKWLNAGRRETVIENRAQVFPGLSWSADGATLYYSKAEFHSPYAVYGDLYSARAAEGSTRQLTHGARAKDPAVCGTARLVFTQILAGGSRLATYDLKSGAIAPLYTPAAGSRVSMPRCSADGQTVYFSEHGREPRDGIYALDLSAEGKTVGPQRHVVGGPRTEFGAIFPEPTAEGLYFTRVKNGFYELARLADNRIYSIKNSGGLWMASRGAKKIAVTYFSSQGFQAALLGDGNHIRLTQSGGEAVAVPQEQGPAAPAATVAVDEGSYWFFRSLAPRIWYPSPIIIGSYRSVFGAGVVGWDDVDQFRYSINLAYDTLKRGPVGDFSASQRFTLFGLRAGLFGEDRVTSYTVNSLGKAYNEERFIGVSLSRPIPTLFASVVPTISAQWGRIYYSGDFGSGALAPELRYTADLVWETRQRVAYSISSEWGFRGKAAAKRYQPATSFHEGAMKYALSWQQLVPVFPRHGVVSVAGHYVASAGPKETLPLSYVQAGGTGTGSNLNPPLRGYPADFVTGKAAGVAQVEYRLPLGQVFRGNDTFPFYMKNLGAYVFGDVGQVQRSRGDRTSTLGGVGGGFLLNTQLFYVAPVNLRIELARGLKKNYGGETQFYLGVDL
jgi:Tol biopolymer transport system component